MKTPAPFCEGHLSLFILCKRIWHFVQYNVNYFRLWGFILQEKEKMVYTSCEEKERKCLRLCHI